MTAHNGNISEQIASVLNGDARWALIQADCREVLPVIPRVGHCLADPPYSERTHAAAAAAAARDLPDGSKRRVYASGANGFGFDHVDDATREAVAVELARIVDRWVLIFSDQEGAVPWMNALAGVGLDHVRIGQWVKEGTTPQFSGDRPAQGAEAIEIAHRKGRKHWNGGGRAAVWTHPTAALEARRNESGRPEHLTPKPLSLMLELVSLFTDPGEVVLDPFAGSGTTGVACLRLGRRFIGIEKDPTYAATATDRLKAEERGQDLRSYRAGQLSLLADQ